MKKSFDIEVKNEKILKDPRRTRETNQGDLTRNKIMVGFLTTSPSYMNLFLLREEFYNWTR